MFSIYTNLGRVILILSREGKLFSFISEWSCWVTTHSRCIWSKYSSHLGIFKTVLLSVEITIDLVPWPMIGQSLNFWKRGTFTHLDTYSPKIVEGREVIGLLFRSSFIFQENLSCISHILEYVCDLKPSHWKTSKVFNFTWFRSILAMKRVPPN